MSSLSIREQLERGRDRLQTIQEDHQAQQALAERYAMTHKKTPLGDRVPVAPETAGLRERLDDTYTSAAEALDTVTAAAARQATLKRAEEKDKSTRLAERFPKAGGRS